MQRVALLVHSGGFTSRQWRRLQEKLAPTHHVLAPDLIGYPPGAAWPVGEPFHFEQDLARLVSIVEAEPNAVGGVEVVGHSYGGLLALKLALARPRLVRSLAVYEPVAFGVLDGPEDDALRREVREVPPYVPDANGIDEAWLARFIDWWNGAGAWSALPPDTKAGFRTLGWKVAQEVLSLLADTTDRATYGTIEAPTLLLGGERTQPAELRVLHNLAAALPNAKLRIFEGMGHMGPVSHAKLVNEAITDHIASITPARSLDG